MARMAIKGIDEYAMKLSKLGADAPKIAKRAVMAGANPVADEIRKNLVENLHDPAYVGFGESYWGVKQGPGTGDLLESFGIAPVDVDRSGNTNTKIGFEGYDQKGVPNVLKARAMESGTSWLKKRPFVRPAVKKTRKKAIDEMGRSIDADITIYGL